jgi:elongation factor 1-gamma
MSTSNNATLYTFKRCFNSKIIKIVSNFTGAKVDIVFVDDLNENNFKKLIGKSSTGNLPLFNNGEFFLSGSVAIYKFLIAENPTLYEILFGSDNKRKAQVESWIEFTSNNIWPFYNEIIGQITGKVEAHEEVFKTAINDFTQVLSKIEKHLTFKTFLVDHKVSIADIALTVALYPYFSLVLDGKMRDSIPNVTRWFSFVANLKEVSSVLGVPRFAQITQNLPTASVAANTQKAEVKVDKKSEVKVDKKSEKKVEAKPVAKPTEVKNEVEEEKKEKKKNPLDELPPTNLDLDSFKKEFLNTDKSASLKKLWDTFDSKGWSIWFLHYNKSGDQGKISFRTCNLKSNFLQVNHN